MQGECSLCTVCSNKKGGWVGCCCQAEYGCYPTYYSSSQMADPSREEEQVTLLGEEGLRAGGQALKLG